MAGIRRRFTGAAAQSRGAAFEDELERTHRVLKDHRLASIQQLPVPTRPAPKRMKTGEGGPPLRVLSARQGYDYTGSLGPTAGPVGALDKYAGLSIAMEAKSTATETTSLPIKQEGKDGAGIQSHQLRALVYETLDFGAFSALVWKNGDTRLVLMPGELVKAWMAFRTGRRSSIPVAMFRRYDLALYPGCGVVEDWLFPARQWLDEFGWPREAWRTMMLRYCFDAKNHVITVIQPGCDPVEIKDVPPIRDADLRLIASESKTVAEFREKLSRVGSANE